MNEYFCVRILLSRLRVAACICAVTHKNNNNIIITKLVSRALSEARGQPFDMQFKVVLQFSVPRQQCTLACVLENKRKKEGRRKNKKRGEKRLIRNK